MTALIYVLALTLIGRVAAESVVELSCSDNATCIDNLTRELVRSLRHQRAVKLFDTLTIEPLGRTRQARSFQGPVARFLSGHAFTFDWNNLSFRFLKPEERSDAVELEVFEGRTAKEVPTETVPKKSSSKVEDEEEEKRPKNIRRRQKRKVLQALIPLVFGMKSAGTVIFAMAVVTALTLKAFVASKLALAVTVGMAMKRLYESYSNGVGLQNHPYLYSQYPIDFPSASSHAYSVSGVSPQFASPELYNPTASLVSHQHSHELLQQGDASAQQSQQAPTLQLANNTRATERWDGKTLLEKLLEPVVDGFKTLVNPIANLFYDAMPATFRGMTSDLSKAKFETNDQLIESPSTIVEEKVKKPKEILVPQPRNIAQRKINNARKRDFRFRPKKYTELKVDLDKLKRNKDFNDYIKTKKYKHNYPYTYYYPRVKYYSDPNRFLIKPNNSRLLYYRKEMYPQNVTKTKSDFNGSFPFDGLVNNTVDDWQPILINQSNIPTINMPLQRSKRSLIASPPQNFNVSKSHTSSTGRGLFSYIDMLFSPTPFDDFMTHAGGYTKSLLKHSVKHKSPPKYYLLTYDMVMFSLKMMDDLVNLKLAMFDHMFGDVKKHHHHFHHHHNKIKKTKKKKQPNKKTEKKPSNETDTEDFNFLIRKFNN